MGFTTLETAQQHLKAAQVQARYDSMSEAQLAREIKAFGKADARCRKKPGI